MKPNLTVSQRILIVFLCFTVAVIGFMVKLPSHFRHIDKELHAVFYFLAAALLNVLFARAKLIRHVAIFIALYLFGMGIEYAQGYSNQFFRSRIHGRFDPEDLSWNLKGLLAFSVLWIVYACVMLMFKKPALKNPVIKRSPLNIIPILKCRNIDASILFYTQILDFEVLPPGEIDFYRLLNRKGARLDLSVYDGVPGSCVYIQVEDVDTLFKKFLNRGLDVSNKTGVHRQPTDQTWGMREFYVEDPDGNTLRFGHVI